MVIEFTDDDLPPELRPLRLEDQALLAVIGDWSVTFKRPLPEVARLLDRFAAGLDALAARMEAERSSAAVAERLLREITTRGTSKGGTS